eukprot:CAMPEP_0197877948 /NCGR_PEP_ID=MMETSP1439-20131203/6478_1 /TAXON_ID=66791 /ORGANISM="Gonyaulax spinifera, Strain CCMP409" /LENGTH=109 /DNA_ID=CAMNT_0043497327 /DNA_START=91 /DNA_END=419 /DNA_ORIENTATION=+
MQRSLDWKAANSSLKQFSRPLHAQEPGGCLFKKDAAVEQCPVTHAAAVREVAVRDSLAAKLALEPVLGRQVVSYGVLVHCEIAPEPVDVQRLAEHRKGEDGLHTTRRSD